MIAGMRIIENAHMVKDGEPYEVRRTWKERLFSLPWRPLLARRTVVPKVPRRAIIQLPNGALVMHPVVAEELRALVKRETQNEI